MSGYVTVMCLTINIQIEFDHHISYLLDRLALRNQMELKRKLEEASLEPSVSEVGNVWLA